MQRQQRFELLRRVTEDPRRHVVLVTATPHSGNEEAFRSLLINTDQSVEQAYLDLFYARRNVDVQKEALFLARDQARITQIRIDVGASAPLDILQPRVQIATTEENLINAVAAVRAAEDRLRALLNVPADEFKRHLTSPEKLAEVLGGAGVDVRYEAVIISEGGLNPDSALAYLMLEKLGQKKVSVFSESVDDWGFAGFALSKEAERMLAARREAEETIKL